MPDTNDPRPVDAQSADFLVRQMIMGFRLTQLTYVAAKLGIADRLAGGPQTAEYLASASGTHPRALYRLLRALISIGLLKQERGTSFELRPLGDCLRTDVPGSLHGMAMLYGDEWYYRVWSQLLHSVQTAQPAFEHVHGVSLFEYLRRHPESGKVFDDAMTSLSSQEAAAILTAYDFSDLARVVDVGGGKGWLLSTILREHPRMRGTLFDQPSVVAGASAVLVAAGVERRCKVSAGDFFSSVPAGGDAYVLKSIIHDWDDEKSIAILRNCRTAMPARARLLLIERVVPQGSEPSEAKLFDISMLVVLGGLERTESEYAVLLATAGFRLSRVIPSSCPLSIIEALPNGRP